MTLFAGYVFVFGVSAIACLAGVPRAAGIVAEIVEGHGWEITLTEAESGGARFETTGVDVETPSSEWPTSTW